MSGSGSSTGTGIGETIGGAVGNAGDAINNAIDGALDMTNLPFDDGASVMLDGKLYRLTGEVIRTDELGPQVLSTTDKVTGIPSKNGEAFGLERETKIYQIKNNTANDAVAVEIGGMYYRANLHAEENASGGSASTKAPASTSSSAAGPMGRMR